MKIDNFIKLFEELQQKRLHLEAEKELLEQRKNELLKELQIKDITNLEEKIKQLEQDLEKQIRELEIDDTIKSKPFFE